MAPDAAETTPEAAARLLGIALPTLSRLIRHGALRPRGPDGTGMLSLAEVIAYRDRQAALRRDALAALARLSETNGL